MFADKLEWSAWSDDLSIGIAAIDQDHKAILDLIGRLHGMTVETGGQDGGIRSFLAELHQYTERHFSREEAMMAAAGYPHQEAHRAKHQAFRDYLAGFDVAQAEQPHPAVLLSWLVDWWVGHIAADDRLYQPFVSVQA